MVVQGREVVEIQNLPKSPNLCVLKIGSANCIISRALKAAQPLNAHRASPVYPIFEKKIKASEKKIGQKKNLMKRDRTTPINATNFA